MSLYMRVPIYPKIPNQDPNPDPNPDAKARPSIVVQILTIAKFPTSTLCHQNEIPRSSSDRTRILACIYREPDGRRVLFSS